MVNRKEVFTVVPVTRIRMAQLVVLSVFYNNLVLAVTYYSRSMGVKRFSFFLEILENVLEQF